MRLKLLKNSGRWRINEMHSIHLDFLRLAADDASMNDCPGARERLYPAPVRGKDAADNEELLNDWEEFVAPELEMKFAGEVGTFLSDLDSAVKIGPSGDDEDSAEEFRLDVPVDHGMAWFSTLNQARLLLDLKYKLHDAEDAPEENILREQPSTDDDAARMLVLMRYEFYAWIQEWLVRHVLSQ